MRIKHRFGFSRDKDIYNCLDKIGMPYEKGDLVSILTIFEDDRRFEQVKALFEAKQIYPLTETVYSSSELESASWLSVRSTWRSGYPFPKENKEYIFSTYNTETYCCKCGAGLIQKANFSVEKEPRWGSRNLWSWLVANIQLQELTESDLKESLDAVPKWLHEYIVAGKYKLTTESLSIGMDVAIYLGEVFVHEFPQIYWGFFTKPKSRVSVNEPVLLGFENGLDMNPRRIVDTLMWQCANGKSSEGLYEVFEIWSKFVPAQPSKTN